MFIGVTGCNHSSKRSQEKSTTIKLDSTLNWIKKVRKKELSLENRMQFLNRAHASIKNITDDSLKVRYYSKLSLAAISIKDSLTFREINRATMSLAKSTEEKGIEAEAYWDLAFFLKGNRVQDSAYYYYAKAHDIYVKLDDEYNTGRLLLNLARVQEEVRDFTGSEINTIKAIELLKPLEEYQSLYECYNLLGIISMGLEEYDISIDNYEEALDFADKANIDRSHFILNNIGLSYQKQGKQKKAIESFNQVLDIKNLRKTKILSYARTLSNLAYSQWKMGNEKGIEEKYKNALKIMDSANDSPGVSASYYKLSEFYLKQKDSTKALTSALKSKKYAIKSTNNYRLLKVLKILGRLDPENALSYTKSYIKLNDSLQQEERKAREKFARIRFETNETKEENRLLARQKQLWVGIAATLLLLALSAFMIIDQRTKNQKLRFQKEQQESNEKIFTLLLAQKQKVEEGKKIAQKRISEELHDGVQGRIQGVRMLLLGLNKRTTPEAIEERGEAIKELMDIQEEVRVISHELSHAAYQKIHNFIQSIEELLLGVKNSAALEYAFEYDDEVDWDGLGSDIKVNLYRMVQESLQNCVKHAKASKVSLTFAVRNRNNLEVSLVDDGKGFVVKKGKKGIGLRNITSRIEKVGGTWDIQSRPGKGTTVIFNIPIQSLAQPKIEHEETALQEV